MQFKAASFALLAACFTILPVVDARINSISAPATISPGKELTVTLKTGSYSQESVDYYVLFSLSTFPPCSGCLGAPPSATFDLKAQGHSNTGGGQFTEQFKAPTTKGNYTLSAAVATVDGASQETVVRFFKTFVNVK